MTESWWDRLRQQTLHQPRLALHTAHSGSTGSTRSELRDLKENEMVPSGHICVHTGVRRLGPDVANGVQGQRVAEGDGAADHDDLLPHPRLPPAQPPPPQVDAPPTTLQAAGRNHIQETALAVQLQVCPESEFGRVSSA
eukprot:1186047-Rhodomonas_salina.1